MTRWSSVSGSTAARTIAVSRPRAAALATKDCFHVAKRALSSALCATAVEGAKSKQSATSHAAPCDGRLRTRIEILGSTLSCEPAEFIHPSHHVKPSTSSHLTSPGGAGSPNGLGSLIRPARLANGSFGDRTLTLA